MVTEMTSTSGRMNTVAEFFSVVIIFIIVLFVTYFVTKWIALFQKGRISNNNINVIETYKVTTNKYIQIVKTGEKYFAIAVCKDTITLLGELQETDIKFPETDQSQKTMSFKEILEKTKFKTDK